MRKRKAWLIGILLFITVLAAAWRFPATIYVPLGMIRHEAFFEGKPTSYWARAFKKEPFLGQALATGDTGKTLRVAFVIAETGFDPAAASDLYSNYVNREIYDPLYRYDFLARPYKVIPNTAAAMRRGPLGRPDT